MCCKSFKKKKKKRCFVHISEKKLQKLVLEDKAESDFLKSFLCVLAVTTYFRDEDLE